MSPSDESGPTTRWIEAKRDLSRPAMDSRPAQYLSPRTALWKIALGCPCAVTALPVGPDGLLSLTQRLLDL